MKQCPKCGCYSSNINFYDEEMLVELNVCGWCNAQTVDNMEDKEDKVTDADTQGLRKRIGAAIFHRIK